MQTAGIRAVTDNWIFDALTVKEVIALHYFQTCKKGQTTKQTTALGRTELRAPREQHNGGKAPQPVPVLPSEAVLNSMLVAPCSKAPPPLLHSKAPAVLDSIQRKAPPPMLHSKSQIADGTAAFGSTEDAGPGDYLTLHEGPPCPVCSKLLEGPKELWPAKHSECPGCKRHGHKGCRTQCPECWAQGQKLARFCPECIASHREQVHGVQCARHKAPPAFGRDCQLPAAPSGPPKPQKPKAPPRTVNTSWSEVQKT
jgi:hypothetical protein